MQRNLIDPSLEQRGLLPLPSAALIIDMRGIEDDDVISRLRIEIGDLASEMKIHEINHWRLLTDFLSFRRVALLQPEDVETIYAHQKAQNTAASQPTHTKKLARQEAQAGLTGDVIPARQVTSPSMLDAEPDGVVVEEKPFDIFQQRVEELLREINRIRNNRIAAFTDLNKSGTPGYSVRDATVRVIFLADAENLDSLASASAYAARLKERVEKLKRENHQPLVSITIMCLNSSPEGGPPTKLIQGLQWNNDWKHIDSLLISEQIREDGAVIEGAMQSYLAELLLYVLLIIPPLTISSPPLTPAEPQPVLQLESKTAPPPKGTWIHLPAATYVIGMAAIEHSARWGRRWMNYGITAQTIEILQSRDVEDDLERRRIRSVAETWLINWMGQVAQAIPDKIPGNIPALKAVSNAISISDGSQNIFTSADGFALNVSKTTLSDLHTYLSNIVRTYTISLEEHDRSRREPSDRSASPTLQDAIDSIPQIEQRLREWEGRDPALKKGTPLVNAQLEAQKILSHPNFFTGARGAIPRARIQLRELGAAISEFKNNHEQHTVDLIDRREQLEKRGNTLIDDLAEHIRDIPLLATKLRLRTLFALVTTLLIFCLAGFTILVGAAWLRHVVALKAPNLLPTVDALFFFNTSIASYVFWGLILIFIVALTIGLGRPLITNRRSSLEIEIFSWLTLIFTSIAGLLLSVSLEQFIDDPNSLALLTWLAPAQPISTICFVVAILILLIEVGWFFWWRNRLLEERQRILNELRSLHRQDINHVTSFIAETIGLQILLGTELTDGKGGPGPYYYRVDQLYKSLSDMVREAKHQQSMAAERLIMSMSETQPGTSSNTNEPWLNLKIREEWLDVKTVSGEYKHITEQLEKEAEELKEFSEVLLRIMGEETPTQIEQQFREKTTFGKEQRQANLFLSILVAVAVRFSIAPQSVSSLSPIIERYENIDSEYIHEQPALSTLIETLDKKVSDATMQPLMQSSQKGNTTNTMRTDGTLGTDALATWGQMLWESKNGKLKKALTRNGILAKLMESETYEARAVMRRLQMRTALFGRSIPGQPGELRLILSPSTESRIFRQGMNISSRLLIDFPDIERLILLYIQRYQAEPMFKADDELDDTSSPIALSINGNKDDLSKDATPVADLSKDATPVAKS